MRLGLPAVCALAAAACAGGFSPATSLRPPGRRGPPGARRAPVPETVLGMAAGGLEEALTVDRDHRDPARAPRFSSVIGTTCMASDVHPASTFLPPRRAAARRLRGRPRSGACARERFGVVPTGVSDPRLTAARLKGARLMLLSRLASATSRFSVARIALLGSLRSGAPPESPPGLTAPGRRR